MSQVDSLSPQASPDSASPFPDPPENAAPAPSPAPADIPTVEPYASTVVAESFWNVFANWIQGVILRGQIYKCAAYGSFS